MSTLARPLAVRLAAATDSQLAELFAARGVPPSSPWHDFFDAAEALLEPASVERALPRLTRARAEALRRAEEGGDPGAEKDALVALALLRPDGTLPSSVAGAVRNRPLPLAADDATPASPASTTASAEAAENALTTIASLADLLLIARESSLAILADGSLSAGERRRLLESGLSSDDPDELLNLAVGAGLLRIETRAAGITASGEDWLNLSAAERWASLATAFREALPSGVRDGSGGWIAPQAWEGAFPWDPAWPSRSRSLQHRLRMLGLLAHDGTEPDWAAALRQGEAAEPELLGSALPAEVDRIFLQNDLSAIAPGPLAPALDVRLRNIAARESTAQASSYRFTADTIARALVLGETEESLLSFLGAISLTGIPQPLGYLISRTAARHGLVRVGYDGERTRISSTDATVLDAIGVDQSLRALGLRRDGDGLTSRLNRDAVYWALTDARYPATLVDENGIPVVVERVRAADVPAPAPDYGPLIARLRASQGPDADAAWLERELEAAVRSRALVVVDIGLPDGSSRELTLEARGLGGGRLRGRDHAADVERTLPVSSIRSARVLDET